MSQQISALRQRLIDDMTIRNMSPLTQKAYVRAVKNFSKHLVRRTGNGSVEPHSYQCHCRGRVDGGQNGRMLRFSF